MKRIILLLMIGGIWLGNLKAQEIQLTGMAGYTFGSQVRTYYGTYKTYNNPNFGGILSYGIAPDTYVEIVYNRFDTEVSYAYNFVTEPIGLATDYIQIGGLQQFPVGNGNILPFGTFSLGTSIFTVKDSYGEITSGQKWMMAGTIAGGVKLHIGSALGIRLQARLGLPLYFNGIYLGTGGAGASLRVPMVQFDLSAGVFIRIGGA